MVPPPTTVTSAKVAQGDWEPIAHRRGLDHAVQGATISAELAGTVTEIGFRIRYRPVKKGDILLKLDASAEQAQLRSAQADAELAKADFERARISRTAKVFRRPNWTRRRRNTTQKKRRSTNIQSLIDKKQIHAPFDGIAGIREVNPVARWCRSGRNSSPFRRSIRSSSISPLPRAAAERHVIDLPVKVYN